MDKNQSVVRYLLIVGFVMVVCAVLCYVLLIRPNNSNEVSEAYPSEESAENIEPSPSYESPPTNLNDLTTQDPPEEVETETEEEAEIENPAEAWAQLAANPDLLTDDNWEQISPIVAAWVEAEGIEIVDTITATIEDEELKDTVIRFSLRTVVENHPEAAFDYTLQFEPTGSGIFVMDENPYMGYILYKWVRVQPVDALNRVLALESDSQKSRLVDDVFRLWVRDDIDGLVEAIPQLPAEVQDTARVSGIAHLAHENIDAALVLFTDLESDAKKGPAAIRIASSWAAQDPEAALNWAQTNPITESIRDQITSTILTSLASTDPEKAFNHAIELPLNEEGIGFETSVLTTLSYTNVDKALELLPKVRAGASQITAYTGVGGGLAMQGRTTEAIELGKELPEDDQLNYYKTVGIMSLTGSMMSGITGSESEQNVFATLEAIPLEAARSHVSMQAILMDHLNNSYSEEEIESLKEYITEEDMEELEKGLEQIKSIPIPSISF